MSKRLSDVRLGGAGDFALRGRLPAIDGSARLPSSVVRLGDQYGSHSTRYDMPATCLPSPPESAPSSPGAASSEASDDDGPALIAHGPRGAVAHSMRAPSSASLADDRRSIHSARHDPPARPAPARAGFREPDAPSASTHREHDWAPKRSGGVISRLAKGVKKLFGKGSSGKHSGSSARVPARHNLDSSLPMATMFRMDSQSPGRGVPRSVRDGAVDARATQEHARPGASSAATGSGRPPLAPSSRRNAAASQPTASKPKVEETDKLLIRAYANTPTGLSGDGDARALRQRVLSFFAGWLHAHGLGTLGALLEHPMLQIHMEACRASHHTPAEVKRRLPGVMHALQQAASNGEVKAAVPKAVAEMKLDEFLDEFVDEFKASLLTQKKPVSLKTAEQQYVTKARTFDIWLAKQGLGRLGDYFPHRLEELRSHLSQFAAATTTQSAPLLALDRFLKAKSEEQPPAQVAEPQPGVPPAHAPYSHAFTPLPDPSSPWPDFDLNASAPEQEVAHPLHPHRQSDSAVFGGLEPLTPAPWDQGWPADPAPDVTSSYRPPQQEAARPLDPPRQTDSAVFGGLEPLTPAPWDQGWPADPAPDVTGPYRPPRQTDSAVFGGLESLTSISLLQGWQANLDQPEEEVTSALRAGMAARGGRHAGASTSQPAHRPPARATPRAAGAGGSRAAPEVIDLDDYEPQQREEQPLPSVSVRLQGNGWMHDNDFIHYGEALASLIHAEMGAVGWARFNERVGIVDPALVRLLAGGTLRSPLQALHRHTAPILFLPVNNGRRDQPGTHWSLLVVNRTAGMAFHYDSLIEPAWLDNPVYTAQVAGAPQYRIAAEATRIILGEHAEPPTMASMPMQRDGHSCGDHVVTGMETLARRVVEGRDEDPIEMDLSGIRPDRNRTIHMLAWHEAIGQRQPAVGADQEDPDTNSAPRKKRR